MKPKVEIIKSCNQDWNEMKVAGSCKFCSVCEKNVFDFTTSNKYDILKKLKAEKEVCGRINLSQIQEINSLKSNRRIIPSKWAVALGLGTILGTVEPIIAQPLKEKVEVQEKSKDTINYANRKSKFTVRGVVTDEIDSPLFGANISLKGTNIETKTNFDGEFSLEIYEKTIPADSIVTVEYLGFESKEINLDKMTSFIKISMKEDNVMEDLVVVGGICAHNHRKNIFGRIGGFFSKLFGRKNCH